MAKFRKYSTATCEQTMFNMYSFIVSSGQTDLRLVNDTGSAVALYKGGGTGFVSSWASASDCPDGSYMVIEPVTACNSLRWQLKVLNAAADQNQVQLSPRGGWTNAAANFGASATTDSNWLNDGAAPPGGSQVYCGTDTFAIDGSTTGTYVWFHIRDTAVSQADQMGYFGHYFPWNVANDVNPVCFAVGTPRVADVAYFYGRNTGAADNQNRVGVEYAQTTSLVSAGYARLGFTDVPNDPGTTCILRDASGYYPPLPCYLWKRNTAIMGHFADHLRIIDGTLNDYDVDDATTPTHICIGHLWLHYDESL